MKREKYPPLKPWQLEVVKKHETRKRLMTGSPYDQAKYLLMLRLDISEEEFDSDSEKLENTMNFKTLLWGRSVRSLGLSFATAFKEMAKVTDKARRM